MPPLNTQWRTLLENPAALARDYPRLAPLLDEPVSRRRTLKLMAASLALGGLAGCDPASSDTDYIPAVIAAPGIVPGTANTYSTVSRGHDDVLGINVAHQMGRPVKVDGNPRHPASLGGSDAFAQAMLLDFYDPDRSGGILASGNPASRNALLTTLSDRRARLARTHGKGFRILSGAMRSPSQGAAIDALLKTYPAARWHQWNAVGRDAVRGGARLAYGAPVEIVPHVDQAEMILALDSDLLDSAPGHVRHARNFAAHRNPTRGAMSRVYAAEPTPTLIGAAADHRFIASAAELEGIAGALADRVLRAGAGGPDWLAAVVTDLRAHRGRALVHAGPTMSITAHAAVHAVNEALGGRNHTLELIGATEHRPTDHAADMAALLADMHAGRVHTLLILEGNPAYAMPGFREALGRVELSLHAAPALDETALAASWFVPLAHDWEAWDDARAYDGTASIAQPMALPLFGGMAKLELLSLFAGPTPVDPMAAVRQNWPALADDDAWHDALASGVIPNTAATPSDLPLQPQAARGPSPTHAPPIELLIRPDPHVWDGRHANNAWLQELPRPLTKLVWDNPLLVSPAMARAHALTNGDEVELSVGATSTKLPVWIMPGQAPNTAVALLGFGRSIAGEVGRGAGFDVTALRTATGQISLLRTGRHETLACTDHHDPLTVKPDSIDPIVHHATLAAFTANPNIVHTNGAGPELYRRPPPGPVAWGMSIDLNACIGCNACMVACQAENNVPVVGKQQVIHQREMHWLRIDRYWEGSADDPKNFFQPMLCQHCEQAPCEVVCPVGATVHDEEGLNTMVYNRCIGTRFCSNNCPYKVRRFNFSAYAKTEHRPIEARNPDVSARSRGVMEKCTFCVQRIAHARIEHDRDGVPEQVRTACQVACPSQAITFGDLQATNSEISARAKSPLSYAVLADHNTHPRVTYEARITNPNPDITA